jgi:hypothetical protein
VNIRDPRAHRVLHHFVDQAHDRIIVSRHRVALFVCTTESLGGQLIKNRGDGGSVGEGSEFRVSQRDEAEDVVP